MIIKLNTNVVLYVSHLVSVFDSIIRGVPLLVADSYLMVQRLLLQMV